MSIPNPLIVLITYPSRETRSRDREVSSYDFDQNRSVSPELGIPDNSHRYNKEDNDDDFGDFAEARSSSQKQTNNSRDNDLFGDFSSSPTRDLSNARLPKPPSVPTSPVLKKNPLSTQANNNPGTLFDLEPSDPPVMTANHSNIFDPFGGSRPNDSSSTNVDLFGNLISSVPSSTPVIMPATVIPIAPNTK